MGHSELRTTQLAITSLGLEFGCSYHISLVGMVAFVGPSNHLRARGWHLYNWIVKCVLVVSLLQ